MNIKVILLLLMSQYLQGTKKPMECWASHGLAVKTALQLGLQCETGSHCLPLERELRKRVWYGCIYLDR